MGLVRLLANDHPGAGEIPQSWISLDCSIDLTCNLSNLGAAL